MDNERQKMSRGTKRYVGAQQVEQIAKSTTERIRKRRGRLLSKAGYMFIRGEWVPYQGWQQLFETLESAVRLLHESPPLPPPTAEVPKPAAAKDIAQQFTRALQAAHREAA